ncbi:MAG: hypothetical protein HC851_19660 [Acaryochloris sp. RU_4_1]|nr:hypothetical protein [Acaryochloris sp. SU_5_25]NJM67722.1 hypothetical protein [Acaryochloris sp. RU_4_1]NJN39104.1 hypothetical protein [Acaryochloridaceae cyanobacterium CSU_3_4]NJR56992.1 hypothetical protein [Acaryochloris sp. CRU_2_0]
MTFRLYNLDREAHRLVDQYSHEDGVLNESHKMRMTVAYGLERFWGEHLRLGVDQPEGRYWKAVWDQLHTILQPAGIELPRAELTLDSNPQAKEDNKRQQQAYTDDIVNRLWALEASEQDQYRVALAVLTQFCDCLVWWTQRYK